MAIDALMESLEEHQLSGLPAAGAQPQRGAPAHLGRPPDSSLAGPTVVANYGVPRRNLGTRPLRADAHGRTGSCDGDGPCVQILLPDDAEV